MQALGLIETVGYLTAVSAADAAVKAADVEIVGIEKVIGVSGYLGVTVHFSGDVAAVKSAVEFGRDAAERIGKVISSHVIPRAHLEVAGKLLPHFKLEKKSVIEDLPNQAGSEEDTEK
ncbi:BMC domain-containing protein [Cytobacillus praedii]|uniref:BMC domain-containing protein n=1 Tax=Cytobacillus praedii TaxID=1742358 RepID=UPI002E251C6E|nr:BMC domain-containing protein [Cytobacillus praedii]